MKKLCSFIFIILCFTILTVLYSCSKSNPPAHDDDSTVYTVTCEKSEFYSYGGTVNSTSGIKATCTLTSNFPAYEITGCLYNGQECTFEEDVTDGKKFSFIMPSENVEIKAIGQFNDLDKSGPNNFLSFDSSNTYTFESARDDKDYNNDEGWGTPYIILYNITGTWMSIADVSCFSTNEATLPSDAINVVSTTMSGSNQINGGRIIINRSMAKMGTTQIVLHVKSGNSLSYDAVIVVTITVTE